MRCGGAVCECAYAKEILSNDISVSFAQAQEPYSYDDSTVVQAMVLS